MANKSISKKCYILSIKNRSIPISFFVHTNSTKFDKKQQKLTLFEPMNPRKTMD